MKRTYKTIVMFIGVFSLSQTIFCIDKVKLAKELSDVIEELLPESAEKTKMMQRTLEDPDMMNVSLSEYLDRQVTPVATALLASHPSYTTNRQLVDRYIKAQQALDGFGKYLLQEMKNQNLKSLVERLMVVQETELPEHPEEEPEMPMPVKEESAPEPGADMPQAIGEEATGVMAVEAESTKKDDESPPNLSTEG